MRSSRVRGCRVRRMRRGGRGCLGGGEGAGREVLEWGGWEVWIGRKSRWLGIGG